MCGTMQVFLNPPGYILSLPLIYTVGIFADAIGGTAGYLIIVGCIAITHYFIGGLIGIGIAKLVPKL
ncbi:MAG: hypothetical protein JWM56_1314 [Candidatus Peribacteria bacterium]|nr:hypothetical protein [Candidatus Peribacteria bacterium]